MGWRWPSVLSLHLSSSRVANPINLGEPHSQLIYAKAELGDTGEEALECLQDLTKSSRVSPPTHLAWKGVVENLSGLLGP